MSVKSRLVAVLFAIFATAVAGFGFVLVAVTFPGFQELEKQAAEASMQRLNNALTNQYDELERLVTDWSYWDDTWAYVADRNSGYEVSNLVDSTFTEAHLSLIWLLDAEGRTVWRRYLPVGADDTVETELLPESLPADHVIRKQVSVDKHLRGIMPVGDDLVLMVASPVMPSEGEAEPRGTLIFARHLDDDRVAALSDLIQHPLTATNIRNDGLKLFPSAIIRDLTSRPDRSPLLDYSQPDFISGLLRLDNILSEPVLLLVTRIDRNISRFGAETVMVSGLLLLVAVVAALVGGYLLSMRTIANPVNRLTRHIEHIGQTGDLETKISLPGDNELSRMAVAFNRMQERLQKLAHFDPVTNLPNRVLFRDRARQMISKAKRDGNKVAIVFIDLDRFKYVNDTFGHEFGDAVLCSTGERLTQCTRSTDTVSRLGGDEFAVVAGNINSAADAEKLARSLQGAFDDPITAQGRDSFIGGSIGIALYPDDGDDIETLLKNSDIAMYRAKAAGGGFEFYGMEASEIVEKRHKLETELQQAIRGEEFELFFQPQVRLADQSVCGGEALIRWQHPDDGWRAASDFMPVMEEIGLFRKVDEWVLKRAQKISAGMSLPVGFVLALNLSSREFDTEDLADMLEQSIDRNRPDTPILELEITQNAMVRPSPSTDRAVQSLRERGVVIALDDFGAGYSSLTYLKTLPVGALKINQSFIRDLPDNPESQSIVKAILSLGESLSYRVIAAGVETQAQHDILKEYGCQIGQGNFYGAPESPTSFFGRFG